MMIHGENTAPMLVVTRLQRLIKLSMLENIGAIIHSSIWRYTDQVGHLWNSLADYYIRSGLFERARDIYEEAIQTVTTVRDLTQVFDTYGFMKNLEKLLGWNYGPPNLKNERYVGPLEFNNAVLRKMTKGDQFQ